MTSTFLPKRQAIVVFIAFAFAYFLSALIRAITATLVRQIAAMGGDIGPFVPGAVAQALQARFARR